MVVEGWVFFFVVTHVVSKGPKKMMGKKASELDFFKVSIIGAP